jgi:hypothetical protein
VKTVKTKRRGRPAGRILRHQISLFLSTPLYRAIEKVAQDERVTFSEALRRILEKGLGKNHN